MVAGHPFDRELANQIVANTLNQTAEVVVEGYPKRGYEADFLFRLCGKLDLLLILNAQEQLLCD